MCSYARTLSTVLDGRVVDREPYRGKALHVGLHTRKSVTHEKVDATCE